MVDVSCAHLRGIFTSSGNVFGGTKWIKKPIRGNTPRTACQVVSYTGAELVITASSANGITPDMTPATMPSLAIVGSLFRTFAYMTSPPIAPSGPTSNPGTMGSRYHDFDSLFLVSINPL
ncbi:hypothetical protein CENSYa_1127 [Cenarchaeum symbiosum A]|uniref:Uncharacterized protein n=1 Tax=Cenarchaeum symbiosum (strain A) TaxID=414004 RepID=A0RWN9_CENSY|nr:hypothetical protein CENSYa_1127 [Cenarchaeum symbiosum A]